MDDNIRRSTVNTFNEAWADASAAGAELERCFKRLADSMAALSNAGCHMNLEFGGPLQEWWVDYRETLGDHTFADGDLSADQRRIKDVVQLVAEGVYRRLPCGAGAAFGIEQQTIEIADDRADHGLCLGALALAGRCLVRCTVGTK